MIRHHPTPAGAPPAISVLMSVWNGMPYLPATVESILAQTFKDFEFVVVDNASTDGTPAFLQRAAALDARVRVLRNDANLGHSGGLNRGLAECRGKWVARIDADDVALLERLERQLAFLNDHPEVKLCAPLAYYINAAGKRVGKTFHDLKTRRDFDRYMATNEMIGLLHPGAIYARELAQSLGGYRDSFGAANDIDLWARMAETGTVILVQQEYLMEYRIHPGQISAGKFFAARLQYEWARACAQARRQRQPEPAWQAFQASLKTASVRERFNRWRKTRAKFHYRNAGLHWTCGRMLAALFNYTAALCCQPGYALRRAAGQRLK